MASNSSDEKSALAERSTAPGRRAGMTCASLRSRDTTHTNIASDGATIIANNDRISPLRRNGKKQTGPAIAPADHAKFNQTSFAARLSPQRSEKSRLVDVIAMPKPRP